MEFKVIFIGFALHCVLNTVLICKSVIIKGREQINAVALVEEEKSMLESFQTSPGEAKSLRLSFSETNEVQVLTH